MESPALEGSVDSGENRIVPPFVPPVLLVASYVPAACHAIRIAIGHLNQQNNEFPSGLGWT